MAQVIDDGDMSEKFGLSQMEQHCDPVFEETCAATQKKRKKPCFWILKKKKRKKRMCSLTGLLITRPLITQLPEVSTGRSPTSNILLRSADTKETMQL